MMRTRLVNHFQFSVIRCDTWSNRKQVDEDLISFPFFLVLIAAMHLLGRIYRPNDLKIAKCATKRVKRNWKLQVESNTNVSHKTSVNKRRCHRFFLLGYLFSLDWCTDEIIFWTRIGFTHAKPVWFSTRWANLRVCCSHFDFDKQSLLSAADFFR